MAEDKSLYDEVGGRLFKLAAEGISLEKLKRRKAESILFYGATFSGKTYGYITIPQYLKEQGIPPEKFKMCIVYPDRPGGVTKLLDEVPDEYLSGIELYPITGDFNQVIEATLKSWKQLLEFSEFPKETDKQCFLVVEMLDEMWSMAQDTAVREAYGVGIGDYMAREFQSVLKRAQAEAKSKKDLSAYQVLQGWTDWTIIKNLHNTQWVEVVKQIPFFGINLICTAGEKPLAEGEEGGTFGKVGVKPAGEKSNRHRVDTIIYMRQKGGHFFIQPAKITELGMVYPEKNVTDQGPYGVHLEMQKRLKKVKQQRRQKRRRKEQSEGEEPEESTEEQEAEPSPEEEETESEDLF